MLTRNKGELFQQITPALCSKMQKWSRPRKKHSPDNVKHGGSCGITLLHPAHGVLNLCRVQWNVKTINLFSCCPSLVLVAGHGFCNIILTQNTQLKTPKNGHKQNRLTILMGPYKNRNLNAVWRKPHSHSRQTGAIWSWRVGQNTCWKLQRSN